MKKVTLILSALALVLGLSQCKKQEEPVQSGEKQHVVLTANNGNDGSKVAVGVSGNLLNLTWEGTETITVTGGASGTLTFKSGEGTADATFEGDITLNRGGDIVFKVGSEPNFMVQTGSVDYNTDWIKNNIYLVGTSDYQPSGNYDVTMELQYAVLLLDLGEFNKDVKSPATMTISTGGVEIASVKNVTTASNLVLVAIPTDGTEKTYIFSSDKGKTATKTWTLEKNVFYTKAGAEGAGTGDAIVIEPDAPATPKFTVGMDGDTPITVEFAPGNLYWDGTDSKWKFEANQWDFRHYNGNDDDAAVIGGESTTTPAGTVGSFFWSKNSLVAVASSYSDPSASTDDTFFTNANDFQVDGKAAGTWRTLSKDEWIYLLNTSNASSGARTDANRFAKARVSGVVGLLVFPDRYTSTASGDGIATVNDISAAYPTASISSDTWTSMESVGAVFLPAAGFRYDTSVRNVGSFGFYWSSSYNDSNSAYYLNFNSVSVSPSFSSYRYNGFSVRLVSEN